MRKPPPGGGPPAPVAQQDLFDLLSPKPPPATTPAVRPALTVVPPPAPVAAGGVAAEGGRGEGAAAAAPAPAPIPEALRRGVPEQEPLIPGFERIDLEAASPWKAAPTPEVPGSAPPRKTSPPSPEDAESASQAAQARATAPVTTGGKDPDVAAVAAQPPVAPVSPAPPRSPPPAPPAVTAQPSVAPSGLAPPQSPPPAPAVPPEASASFSLRGPPAPPPLAAEPRGYKPYPWRTQTDAADPAKARAVLSVAELTRQIKGTLERAFPRVLVKGEITGFRGTNPRGHAYFSLKDADACIEVKMWASTVARLKFKLRDGLQVVVDGSVDVYEPAGKYSLIASKIEPSGEGALALAFQQLKEKLGAEGLLGDRRLRSPRPLPFLPRRIGVVTSRTGAALQDFLRVLYQRHPRASVLICDARVQGEGAAREVVSGLQRLARTDVDVIVVTRGGGSVEDLWTFNEEVVARAIHASPVPVISAIGHEVDFTIADFVADHRAPTPTAAAQLVAPVLSDLHAHLLTTAGRLRKGVERRVLEGQTRLQKTQARLADPRRLLGQKQLHLSEQADRLVHSLRKTLRAHHERQKNLTERLQRKRPQAELAQRRAELSRLSARLRKVLLDRMRQERQHSGRLKDRLTRLSPAQRVEKAAGDLSRLESRLAQAVRDQLARRRSQHGQLSATLHAVSPLGVMSRGYAVVRNAGGHVVRGAAEVSPGETLAIQLAPRPTEDLSGCDEIVVQVTKTRPGAP